MKDNKDNSRHLGRKYALIFVLGHYLFLVALSFPRAKLEENCSLLGTDNVRGQISEHISAPNGDYCLYIQEPEANNCFSIITQVIIEIPKQRNVTILPQFAIVDKSSYHVARINVSRNAFLNSRSKEKSIFFDVHTG